MNYENTNQQYSVDQTNATVQTHKEEDNRDRNHDRNIKFHKLTFNYEWTDHSGNSKNQKNVGNIATNHVSHGEVWFTTKNSADTDRELRCRRCKRDYNQSDH